MFSCIAYGVPLPTFLWTRNRHSLFNDSSTVIYENKTTKEGIVFVKSVLEICNLRVVEDSGVYSCRAESVSSRAESVFELAVQGKFLSLFCFLVCLFFACLFGFCCVVCFLLVCLFVCLLAL